MITQTGSGGLQTPLPRVMFKIDGGAQHEPRMKVYKEVQTSLAQFSTHDK